MAISASVTKLLDSFSLERHGDASERKFWARVKDEFPSYEVFWRLYVVPLTHRIDSSVASTDPRWIRVRSAVPDRYLRYMMSHYSVFYCIGRASERIAQSSTIEYAEDIIYLLQAAGENLARFLSDTMNVAKDADAVVPLPPPSQFPKGYDQVFSEIKEYRDTLLHNPILGRAVDIGRQYLPVYKKLREAKDLWRNAERLTENEFVESTALIQRLCGDSKAALEKIWSNIIGSLQESKMWDKIAANSGALDLIAANSSGSAPTTWQSTAPSGSIQLPRKK